MEHVHAVGTFVRFGGETFRTEARIYFRGGVGHNLLLIGMNPGSCMLAQGSKEEFEKAKDGHYVTGEIVLDKTMQHIIQMMDEACPEFEGTLYMINLFNIRNGKIGAAIKKFVTLSTNKSYRPYLLSDFGVALKARTYSAVWLGWSLRDESNVNKRKREVKRTIDSFYTSTYKPINPIMKPVAKYKKNDQKSIHVWHFKPLLDQAANNYRNDVVPLLREILS